MYLLFIKNDANTEKKTILVYLRSTDSIHIYLSLWHSSVAEVRIVHKIQILNSELKYIFHMWV